MKTSEKIVALLGILFIAALLVDQATCFVTKNQRREFEVSPVTQIRLKKCLLQKK